MYIYIFFYKRYMHTYIVLYVFFLHRHLPVVFNPALSRIEFKIFYNIFCESFKLKLTTFAFDSYVEIVFEKFILGLIHIDIGNWVFICGVLFLQWFRLRTYIHTYIHTYLSGW